MSPLMLTLSSPLPLSQPLTCPRCASLLLFFLISQTLILDTNNHPLGGSNCRPCIIKLAHIKTITISLFSTPPFPSFTTSLADGLINSRSRSCESGSLQLDSEIKKKKKKKEVTTCKWVLPLPCCVCVGVHSALYWGRQELVSPNMESNFFQLFISTGLAFYSGSWRRIRVLILFSFQVTTFLPLHTLQVSSTITKNWISHKRRNIVKWDCVSRFKIQTLISVQRNGQFHRHYFGHTTRITVFLTPYNIASFFLETKIHSVRYNHRIMSSKDVGSSPNQE
jgi:hypothetical protein